MELAENGNLIGDMKIHQDQEVSERDTEDLQEAIVDNQEAIEYFFTDIKYSLETSFALHQAKLIIAAESNFKDLLNIKPNEFCSSVLELSLISIEISGSRNDSNFSFALKFMS